MPFFNWPLFFLWTFKSHNPTRSEQKILLGCGPRETGLNACGRKLSPHKVHDSLFYLYNMLQLCPGWRRWRRKDITGDRKWAEVQINHDPKKWKEIFDHIDVRMYDYTTNTKKVIIRITDSTLPSQSHWSKKEKRTVSCRKPHFQMRRTAALIAVLTMSTTFVKI